MRQTTFDGFEPPNTTPVPDIVFDELLGELTGNELKVLLYIIRRTYGFGKNADAISLSQFREGIITQEGKVLDKGCGIKHNRTILAALVCLEKKKYITATKRKTNAGDKDTTTYKLNFKKTDEATPQACSSQGVVTPSNHVVTPSNHMSLPQVTTGSYSTSLRVVTPGNIQETVLQETEIQDIPPTIVSTPEPLTTNVVALPSFSSEQEQRKPKNKAIRSEVQDDDEAQERRRGIYQRIVARRGYEIDGKARISEYAAIKQLAEKYTDEQIEAIHRYLFETDWRWSKMDNQYKIGACVIAAEAQSVLQILKTKTPSSPSVSAPPIPPKPMKSRLVQDLDEKRERYANKKG